MSDDKARIRASVGTLIFLAMFASIVVVLTCSYLFDFLQSRKELIKLEQQTLQAVIPAVGGMVEMAMLHEKRGHIDEVFESLRRNRAFSAVQLLDDRRNIVQTRDFVEGRPPQRLGTVSDPGPQSVMAELPLRIQPACARCHGISKQVLGYVRLIAPLDRAKETVLVHKRRTILTAGLGLFLLGLLSIGVVRIMILGPVRHVVSAMERVRSGDLSTRLQTKLPGEFALIAGGFSAMVEALEKDRREIVELRRRQMSQVDRLVSLGELAANFAHEVRNPLTSIGSAIQVFLKNLPEGDSKKEILGKVLEQVDRLNKIMAGFLTYARVPEAQLRPFPIREPLHRVHFLLEPRLRAQQVEFVSDLAKNLPEIEGDPNQVEQVLLNLCLNALQAMPSGGRLSVSARAGSGGDDLLMEIHDTGHGIPPELLDKVFQPFFTTRPEGSGLGLAIVRQIVGAHGGETWIESVPGHGTTVFVRLHRRHETRP